MLGLDVYCGQQDTSASVLIEYYVRSTVASSVNWSVEHCLLHDGNNACLSTMFYGLFIVYCLSIIDQYGVLYMMSDQ